VRRIDDGLGIGHVVNGGDHAMRDADRFVNDLHDRREAVRCAGCGGEQAMAAWLVQVVVDADHDVQGAGLDRCRDDDLLDARREVRSQRLGRSEFAAALQNNVDIVGRPRPIAGRGAEENAICAPSIVKCPSDDATSRCQRPCTESNVKR
jgi:hypothetical protein